ncbi:hypothetical protein DWB85_09020 [Seongchinamella sediminis]|uniref:Magnesium transporter MgtE intracellular domain-containing protein n=1 Tax=Seongchinamella sediminis TaxID=2283635 RepID=A0A3L7DZH0_9GAMM|nr:hypothetical protein DWB85_09020 [Seongchinamella sediminis]
MQIDDQLLLQFAAEKPDDMAALLTSHDLAELQALVESLPLATAAGLMACLSSWQLMGLLRTLDPALVGRLLLIAQGDDAVTLASHLHESRYSAVLETVPKRQRRPLCELLEFPTHSVASLVTKEFIRVTEATSCGDFYEQLSVNTDTSPRTVLVIDEAGKYLGLLGLQAVIARKNRGLPVGEVADPVEALNGFTNVRTAVSARQWLHYPELPVVDGRHRVIGVVSRATVTRVAGDASAVTFNLEQIFSEMANAYLDVCARLLEATLDKHK